MIHNDLLRHRQGPGAGRTRLTESPLVRMLTFTGSTEIGKMLMEQAARHREARRLELGGNAPFIVFDDADLDRAVAGAHGLQVPQRRARPASAPTASTCRTASTTRSPRSSPTRCKKLKVGAGTEEGVTSGPLINKAAVEKVEEHVADALENGAKIVVGGKRHPLGGNFFEPTVLADVTHADVIAREETFGPVAPLFRFKTEDEVIAHGQRHAVRARRLFLRPRRRPRLARRRGARVRHHRHQRGHHLDRGGAVRRLARNRASAAKARTTASRNSSRSSTC